MARRLTRPGNSVTMFVAAILIALLCVPTFATAGAEKIPIRIAWQPAEEMRFYAAKALGLFEEAGLAPEYVKFAAGPPMFAAFSSASVDVGYMWMAPAVIGLAQGINWKYIMVEGDGPETEGLVVRRDLGSLADLKGKTIAVTKGTSADFAFFRLLSRIGISPTDVKILDVVPTIVVPAFTKKDVDGAYIWEPWMTKLVNEGGRVLATDKDANLGGTGLWLAREEWLRKSPEAALRFIAALDAATKALTKDRGPAVRAMVEALAVTSEEASSIFDRTYLPSLTEQLDATSPFGLMPGTKLARDLKEMGQFLVQRGRITAVPDTDKALEPALLKRYLESKKK